MRTLLLFAIVPVLMGTQPPHRQRGLSPETTADVKRCETLADEAARAMTAGDLPTAEEKYSAELKIAETLPDSLFHLQTDSLRGLAAIYLREQKYKESIELFRRRQAILQRLGTPMDPDVGIAMEDIASAYLTAHEYLDAEDNLKRAITFFEQCVNKLRVRGARSSLSPCDGHLTLSRGYLGILYFQQSRFGDAEPLLKMTTSLPDDATLPVIMMGALRAYASILQRSNRDKEAAALLERLERLRATHPDVVAQAEATLREQRAR